MKQCAPFNISFHWSISLHGLSLWHSIIRNEISLLMVYHICLWRTKPCNVTCSDTSWRKALNFMISSYRLVKWVVVLIHKLMFLRPWCNVSLNTCGLFNNEVYETESEESTAIEIWRKECLCVFWSSCVHTVLVRSIFCWAQVYLCTMSHYIQALSS